MSKEEAQRLLMQGSGCDWDRAVVDPNILFLDAPLKKQRRRKAATIRMVHPVNHR